MAARFDLRCFCTRKPLLAVYGRDDKGRIFLHVKIYKQGRIFGEVLIYGGETKIHCRECLRWHRITFDDGAHPNLVEDSEPDEVYDD